MLKKSGSFTLLVLSFALIGPAMSANAQKTQKEGNPPRGLIEKGDGKTVGRLEEKGGGKTVGHPNHSNLEKKESLSEGANLKAVKIEIRTVTKDDAKAQKSPDGKSRLVPVHFQWLSGSSATAKLVSLEALLETVNTDGAKTRVSKKLADWTPNKLIDEIIDLPMPEGVFARDFKLTLKGKCRPNNSAELVTVNEVKSGSFPPQANLLERKK